MFRFIYIFMAYFLIAPLGGHSTWAEADNSLILGSKNFTEQHLLSAITAQYLTAKGYDIKRKTDLASVIMRNALEHGQLDMVWDYTGTALLVYYRRQEQLSAEDTYNMVKTLDAKKGLVWLKPAKLNNTYALAMQRKRAKVEAIRTVSDLVRVMQRSENKHWKIGLDMEFAKRPDGLQPMQARYRWPLARKQIRQMDPGLVYNAIRDGFVEAGLVYTTDGRVTGFDLLVLEDDQQYFPSYAATPVVQRKVLKQYPELETTLNTLSSQLDNHTLSQLNTEVDVKHRLVQEVAAEFLQQHSLLQK